MEIAGYLASLIIGISLGLIGGGGSILTVPVMVYLFNVQPLLATSYSLFVVGSTSLFGAANNYKRGFVNINTAFLFGVSSIATVFLTRKFIIPAITRFTITIAGFTITESMFTMVLFALLMVIAAVSMIKTKKDPVVEIPRSININIPRLLLYGIVIGFITGLLGAGGGFMLIPTLVIVVGLQMKEAVGTSLLIIALNSLIGFTGDLGHFNIDWKLLLRVTAFAIAGIFIGGTMAKKIPAENLKKGFGWFLFLMGIYIILKEVFLK
ncbi:MAG: sulfite exporter TauE/SafE family protein [Ferruginibacter sp.]